MIRICVHITRMFFHWNYKSEYFESFLFFFQVYVNDSSGYADRARVFIYLLREDQRVRFILRQSPEEVRRKREIYMVIVTKYTLSFPSSFPFLVNKLRLLFDMKLCFVLFFKIITEPPVPFYQVREQVEYFRDYLGNVTGAIVNVDDFRVHENHDGTVDKTKTDLYLHLVDRKDNSVLEVQQVLAMIDENVEYLDNLFKVGLIGFYLFIYILFNEIV